MTKNSSNSLVLVLDSGGRYGQEVARWIRGLHVYCEVYSWQLAIADIKAKRPIGIVLTGGSCDGQQADSSLPPELLELGVPVLGIGCSVQAMVHALGGRVAAALLPQGKQEDVRFQADSPLFAGLAQREQVPVPGVESILTLPGSFASVPSAQEQPYLGIQDAAKNLYGLQSPPSFLQEEAGTKILHNFLYEICGAAGDWSMADYAEDAIAAVRKQVGDGRVLLALSGGVDSSVLAALLSRAVGKQLTCIFVDHGLMRKQEGDEVETAFADWDIHFVRVNCEKRFLDQLAGMTDPEQKRKIIGEEFIRVFEEEAKKIGQVDFLAQGTIYPDVIESGTPGGAVIKSHHNVGGLPEKVDFRELVEPLRLLFKNEVRALGQELGLSDVLVWRQPFPGPGLAIRCLGEVTKERLEILREADAIFRQEIAYAGLDREIHQYFAVLTNLRSVGVVAEERTYDYTVALRGVTTVDFMTAAWARIPYDVLAKASERIIAEVPSVNRVVYDITGKPPSTIEWE